MSIPELGELKEEDWNTMLGRIADGKCTPFLGAGVNAGLLPLGSAVSRAWAKEFGYPLENCDALDQVAEFLAVQREDPMVPKERFIKLLHSELAHVEESTLKAFLTSPEQPLSVLASLPLPIYITTNYDDLLIRALKARDKAPRRELCRWNKHPKVKKFKSVFDSKGEFVPDKDNPVVFHLHGHDEIPESLVLTEDDYLDFLVNISKPSKSKQSVLPARIEEALTGASLLFVGYRLADINFRVIFKGLVGSLEDSQRRINISVQLPPDAPGHDSEQIKRYLAKYFGSFRVHVFWGTANEFATQLGDRWKRYKGIS